MLAAILLTRYRWWPSVGLLHLPRWADIRLLVVPALLALFPLTDGFKGSHGVEDRGGPMVERPLLIGL